jgi:superfamily II RNA helicase
MGVNMPARSVVFNGFQKHDGKSRRDLLPGGLCVYAESSLNFLVLKFK